jgi:hypothetical protein
MIQECTCGAVTCVCTTRPFNDSKLTGVRTVATKDDNQRVVNVNAQAFQQFKKIWLKPPDIWQFDIADLDRQLEGQDIDTRMKVKGHLRDAGLLPQGTRLDSVSASAETPPAAAFASLPPKVQHIMKKGGLQGEMTEAGGISVSHLEA